MASDHEPRIRFVARKGGGRVFGGTKPAGWITHEPDGRWYVITDADGVPLASTTTGDTTA